MAIGGFYREWTQDGQNSEAAQISRMEIFLEQVEKVSSKYEYIMILGDANLDSNKWEESGYLHHKVTKILKGALNQNGLIIKEVGNSYVVNHVQKNGNISESALDHVYSKEKLGNLITIDKLTNCSSDHYPI